MSAGGVWEVVGGKDSGGITVRTGKDLKSPEAAGGRLSHGALIGELVLEGERLRFTRLTGTGPDDGWVSLSFKNRPLVARAGEPGTQAAKEKEVLEEITAARERGERLKPKPGCHRLWILDQGSRGDIQPMIALANKAQNLGWVVRFFASEEHEGFAKAYGLDFFTVGPKVWGAKVGRLEDMSEEEVTEAYKENQEELTNSLVADLYSIDVQMDLGKKVLKELETAKENDALPDAILYHPLAGCSVFYFWKTFGIPLFFLDYVAAPLSPDSEFVAYFNFLRDNDGVRLKQEFGVNPFEDAEESQFVDWKKDRTLCCASKLQVWTHEVMGYPEEVWKGVMDRFYGACVLESALQMKDLGSFGGFETLKRAQDFIDAGDKPAYVGWGSMPMGDEILAKVLVNMKFVKLRVIFVVGWSKCSLDGLTKWIKEVMPEDPFGLLEWMKTNILFMETAPHEWLFPRCCLTLHHGGAGTTQAALRAGVPTIITPFGMDQFGWADWTIKLGCGQMLKLTENSEKLMDPAWTKALRKASSDATLIAKAKEVAAWIHEEKGTTAVLEKIKDGVERKARGEDAGRFGC